MKHKISFAERVPGGVIVDFDDGISAIYTADFLYKSLGEVETIILDSDDWSIEEALPSGSLT